MKVSLFVLVLAVLLFSFVTAKQVRCPTKDGRRAVLIADPKSCSRFYICSNGVPVRHNCPPGLQFNSILNVCDWPASVRCRGPRSLEEQLFDSNDSEE